MQAALILLSGQIKTVLFITKWNSPKFLNYDDKDWEGTTCK